MFIEAIDRLKALGGSVGVILPSLVIGLIVFGLGLLVARGVRAGVSRAAQLRAASAARQRSWAVLRAALLRWWPF